MVDRCKIVLVWTILAGRSPRFRINVHLLSHDMKRERSSHISPTAPLLLMLLNRFQSCFHFHLRLLIGQRDLMLRDYSATSLFGPCLTSFHSLHMRCTWTILFKMTACRYFFDKATETIKHIHICSCEYTSEYCSWVFLFTCTGFGRCHVNMNE